MEKALCDELEAELKTLCATRLGRRAFMIAAPTLLAACASQNKTRYREGDNSGQSTRLTVADEMRMTKEIMPKMRQDYPPINDPQIQNYVASLGQKIVTANGLRGKPYNYSFTAVGVNQVNAFALPAGTIFVTLPLMAMADTEAELAGVVGHEIGHVVARHSAERIDRAEKEKNNNILWTLGGGLLGGAAGFGLGKLMCPPKDKKCLEKAATLGAAAGAGGALLIQKYRFMANSREDEMEADRVGFKTAYRAGFDRRYVGDFYSKLLQMEKQAKAQKQGNLLSSVADAMSTHPPSDERVGQMNEMSAQAAQQKSPVTSSREFEKVRQRARNWVRRVGSQSESGTTTG